MASTLVTLPRRGRFAQRSARSFDAERIRAALASAGQASGEYGAEEAALLTAQVTKVLIHRFHGEAPTVEQIQDVAEQTLIAANHLATARAYIVYREAARHAARRQADAGGCGKLHPTEYLTRCRLARERERQPGLLAGRADPERGGRGHGQLLAVARVHA